MTVRSDGALPADTSPTRARHKQRTEHAELDALLDEVHLAHVALIRSDGRPLVLPTACARAGDELLIHGSTGAPWLRSIAGGAPVSVAVTAYDGLVVARSAFESSMHYRSAVLFGVCRAIDEPVAKRAALDALTDALIPGRVSEVRASTAKEIAATAVLALPIEQWSLKVSDSWPDDPDDDVQGAAWAGTVAVETVHRAARAAPDLRAGVDVPPSVRRLTAG